MSQILLFLSLVLCVVFTLGNKVNPTSIDVTTKKYSPALALARKTTDIAQHADVLRKISKQLHQHARISPLNKAFALEKLSKDVKRKANKKDRAVVTIIKKTLPQSMSGLKTLKKKSEPSIKLIIKRMIQKVGDNVPPVSVKRLNKEAHMNHRKGVKVGKQTVKVLRNMKKEGVAIPPKRAANLIKKALSIKTHTRPETAIKNKKHSTLRKIAKPPTKIGAQQEKVNALRRMVIILEKSLLRLMDIPKTIKYNPPS